MSQAFYLILDDVMFAMFGDTYLLVNIVLNIVELHNRSSNYF